MPTLPMFPLGGVLFPTLVLPLHVFEPRYRQLVDDCLAGDEPEFGVVLIERGSEVGGGDVRTRVGTVARILEAAQTEDGRWALVTAGQRRIQVVDWLADDPYPKAEVEDWPDDDASLVDALVEPFEGIVTVLRQVLGLRAELGEPASPVTVEIEPDPMLGSLQASALSTLGPHDQQRLLEAPGTADRLVLLGALLNEEAAFLRDRLAMG